MTRDEAIEAGARVILAYQWPPRSWGIASDHDRAYARRLAAAVLDAIGWAEPRGYVIAVDDRDRPGTVYGPAWPDLEGARGYAIRGERIWGLVPVEGAIEPGTNS